jgi:hypothetical protein
MAQTCHDRRAVPALGSVILLSSAVKSADMLAACTRPRRRVKLPSSPGWPAPCLAAVSRSRVALRRRQCGILGHPVGVAGPEAVQPSTCRLWIGIRLRHGRDDQDDPRDALAAVRAQVTRELTAAHGMPERVTRVRSRPSSSAARSSASASNSYPAPGSSERP